MLHILHLIKSIFYFWMLGSFTIFLNKKEIIASQEIEMNIEEYKQMIDVMTEENIANYYKNQHMRKYDRLNYIFVRVKQLLDFMNVIDTNFNQLKSPANQATVELIKKGIRPGGLLYEYIILEISSFYTLVHKYKMEGAQLPEIPSYWKTLKVFRNAIPGHMDKEEKIKTSKEWFEKYELIDGLNILRIITEFEKYYIDSVKLLGEDI